MSGPDHTREETLREEDYDTFVWFATPQGGIPIGVQVFTDGSLLDAYWKGMHALGWAFVVTDVDDRVSIFVNVWYYYLLYGTACCMVLRTYLPVPYDLGQEGAKKGSMARAI